MADSTRINAIFSIQLQSDRKKTSRASWHNERQNRKKTIWPQYPPVPTPWCTGWICTFIGLQKKTSTENRWMAECKRSYGILCGWGYQNFKRTEKASSRKKNARQDRKKTIRFSNPSMFAHRCARWICTFIGLRKKKWNSRENKRMADCTRINTIFSV